MKVLDLSSGSLREPDFFIIGTPRSGTTLIQRLVCELKGVVVPRETHFFSSRWDSGSTYAIALAKSHPFPLEGAELEHELRLFNALPSVRHLDIDVDAVVALLQGRCESVAQLFSAILSSLAAPALAIGEKTPAHLQWWRPLAAAFPRSRFIGVVRDPRAVVASLGQVPWSSGSAGQLARRWAADQRELRRAARSLGGERVLVVHYEDVVSDPDRTRRALAAFLGVPYELRPPEETHALLAHVGEEPWKRRAQAAISPERISAWEGQLTPEVARRVMRICWRQMVGHGYASGRRPWIGPADIWRDLRLRLERFRRSAAARRLASKMAASDADRGI